MAGALRWFDGESGRASRDTAFAAES